MDWRIEEIQIRNFKYAHELFPIKIGRRNMLLYGENGCGKSSIYWALYTLYQSYFKEDAADVSKYFDPTNNQNLLNRYHIDPTQFLIKVIYTNNGGGIKTLELSPADTTIVRSSDNFVQNTATFSDFINYKTLSSFFDFRNSMEPNIFPFIEKDLFPLLDLTDKCVRMDGNRTTTSYAGEWWKYIREAVDDLPLKDGWVDTEVPAYEWYQGVISDFNDRLREKLLQWQDDANQILRDVVGIQHTEVEFIYSDAIFNRPLMRHPDIRDEKIHDPKILVKIKVDRDIIPMVNNRVIDHPKTFFNEAQLTCIAFAIRLALFEERSLYNVPDSNALLCLDDVLISLDMANRIKIMEILLKYSRNYQMIIMTHDRSFYKLLQMEIERVGLKSDWIYKQMFIPEEMEDYAIIPEPQMLDDADYMSRAKRFIKDYDYAAAANCLRKQCEIALCGLYPSNELLKPKNSDGTREKLQLNELMQKLPRFYDQYGLPDLTPHLNSYRKMILNPMSHADIDTSFFRNEIRACMKEIEELMSLRKSLLCVTEIDNREVFLMKVNCGTSTCQVDFIFNEQIALITYGGNNYYSNSKVEVQAASMFLPGIRIGKEYPIKRLLVSVCQSVGMPAGSEPDLSASVCVKSTALPLC